MNRMPSIMKCHCILFILVTTFISFLVFAKKVSLQKISNQASFRWSNKIIFFLIFIFILFKYIIKQHGRPEKWMLLYPTNGAD